MANENVTPISVRREKPHSDSRAAISPQQFSELVRLLGAAEEAESPATLDETMAAIENLLGWR